MSYGNYSIYIDLQAGVPMRRVARRITIRYPDIKPTRAMNITRKIRDEGPDTSIDWGRKQRGMKP